MVVLRKLWAGWKAFGHFIGVVNRTILLAVFYWVFVDLINIGLRLARVDLLDRRYRPAPTYWHAKAVHAPTYQNQF